LAGPRRKSLWHDKQWMQQVASADENHLLCGEIKDAFASTQQLKHKCATSSAPLNVLDGKLLSDRASVAARWQEHFGALLNRPTQSPLTLWYLKHRHPRQIPPLLPFLLRSLRSIKPLTRSRHQEYVVSIYSASNTVAVMPYVHCTK